MLQERPPFLGAQRTRLSHAEATDSERSHPHSRQASNREAQDQQAPTDLSLATFDQGEREDRVALVGIEAESADACRRRPTLFEGDALLEATDRPVVAAGPGTVRAFVLPDGGSVSSETRMHHGVSTFPNCQRRTGSSS